LLSRLFDDHFGFERQTRLIVRAVVTDKEMDVFIAGDLYNCSFPDSAGLSGRTLKLYSQE
jgi:hypothetical protein